LSSNPCYHRFITFGTETNYKAKAMSLLTISNPKTQKSVKEGYLTAIQHFAPSTLSGTNVCNFATGQCIKYCLNKAGRGGIFKAGEKTNVIQEARIARTKMFLQFPYIYSALLIKEVKAHVRKSKKLDLTPCIRLNGTSDIRWEDELSSIFWRFEDVQFYDYTKDFVRMQAFLRGELPKNYHLTFSRSELNDDQCDWIISHGGSVAVVFESVPHVYKGKEVANGDDSDLRFLDTPGYIGLTAKGKLAREESSFKVTTYGGWK
tara:strand:+ start:691 stop:1476 length:786 start_codon:yes stop_codon:yes gene_type:complete